MTEKQQSTEQTTQTRKPKKKLYGRILWGVAVLVIIPVLTLVLTLSTQSGQQGLIRLADKFSEALSIEQVSGNLGRGLQLHNLRFQSPGIDVLVENTRLQLDFSCLWRARLCIGDFSLNQPVISIDTTQIPPSDEAETQDSGPLRRISLPIAVGLDNLAVENLHLDIDNNQIALAQFKTALTLDNQKGLTLLPTTIDKLHFVRRETDEELMLEQSDAAGKNQMSAAQIEAKARQIKQEIEQLSSDSEKEAVTHNKEAESLPVQEQAAAPIDWDLLERNLTKPFLTQERELILPLDIHIRDLQAKDWLYENIVNEKTVQKIHLNKLKIQADAADNQVRLNELSLNSSAGDISAVGNWRLDSESPLAFRLDADIRELKYADELLLPATRLELDLAGQLRRQTELKLHITGALQAQLNAQVKLAEEKMPLKLELRVERASYPFDSVDPLKINDLKLDIEGDLIDYRLALQGKAQGMGISPSQLDLTATGKLYRAELEKLRLNALKGSIDLKGEVQWREGVGWQAQADLNKLNLSAYVKDFPALLSGRIISSGMQANNRWQADFPLIDIQGSVSGKPLNLKGALSSGSETLLNVPEFVLNYGNNKLSAGGVLGRASAFNLNVDAPNLQGLLPTLNASLYGKASLNGELSAPDLAVDLKGTNIRFQDLRLNAFTAKGNISSAGQIQGNLDIALEALNYGENIRLNSAKLSAKGNEGQHELHLRSEGEPVAARLDLNGSFDRASQRWKGKLSQTEIFSPAGSFKNNEVSINYDHKAINAEVSAHCWTNPDVEFCFPQSFNAGLEGSVPFEIKKADLALVNKLIEQETLKGRLQSKGKVQWFSDKPLRFDMQVQGSNLGFAQKVDYRTFRFEVAELNLNTQLADNNLGVKSDIRIRNNGNISADLKLQDLAGGRKLGGTFKIERLNLSLLNQLLRSGESVSGEIRSALTLGGDLNKPLLKGSVDIASLGASIQSMPFELKNSSLTLQFQGNSSSLRGELRNDDSRLELSGEANWKDVENWNTRVHARADQFRLDIPSIGKLKISPNVEMKASPKLLELSGLAEIPWARLEIDNLPESAVSVSSDEVILEANRGRSAVPQKLPQSSGMAIKSDLKIHIGNDVTLNAYGLNTHLQGLLSVRQDNGDLGLFGQIDLKNGRYASFGQDLIIRKGQISFSGLPSQPMLNIEAIRNPEAMEDTSVVAGVKVIGVAEAPEVTVFSEPGMPQDQALSYILTGRSLENSGEAGSGGSIGAALLGMGLAKSGKAVGGIGQAFGIQDLNLGTAGVGDSSKVVVSGNITPRLQVKYGVGLFDGLAEFTVRYKLFPQLYLQSVTGVNQAVDLLYQFEF
ncbi:autotransporter secretion inner membrane protein TamB [Mesocricetibacter intestinalis]|uniref:Autotransporter secretion inner membrane protein TamB n=1 Tax=Mesocricetibacter intestinalis TaxID=1521930 RepID=A0A4R6VBZ4_9PAST|nr:translocation/assembly module TamB domain-containing protein [Mesocricetibacter intestinalis]TDQ57599.1 autotransporter secretion inner membrane protein TamB [Mesocricetibacter intestinalis]